MSNLNSSSKKINALLKTNAVEFKRPSLEGNMIKAIHDFQEAHKENIIEGNQLENVI